MNPREQAIHDQARAAALQARLVKVRMDRENPAGSSAIPDRVLTKLLERLFGRLANESTKECPHREGSGPAVSFWLAHHPRLLGCDLCTKRTVRLAKPAPSRCDGCGTAGPTVPASAVAPTRAATILVVCSLCEYCLGAVR